MIEFCFSSVVLCSLLVAGARLLLGEWQSTRCSYLTFEAAHSELTGRALARELLRVDINGDRLGISAHARCGEIEEQVRLPRLEPDP